MTYIPDLSAVTYNEHPADSGTWLSVGWLGDKAPNTGDTSAAVLESLQAAKEQNQLPDGWLGLHTCEICNDYHDKGEFFIADGPTRYVLPNMVIHYIQGHRYRLPEVVEAALLSKEEK